MPTLSTFDFQPRKLVVKVGNPQSQRAGVDVRGSFLPTPPTHMTKAVEEGGNGTLENSKAKVEMPLRLAPEDANPCYSNPAYTAVSIVASRVQIPDRSLLLHEENVVPNALATAKTALTVKNSQGTHLNNEVYFPFNCVFSTTQEPWMAETTVKTVVLSTPLTYVVSQASGHVGNHAGKSTSRNSALM